jgi:hypothetical protein
MSYSDQERLRLRAKEGLDVPLEPRRATTPEGHGHPKVYCELQQLKERREHGLDNTLSETFPCSDPLSSIPDPTSHSF